jgi:hypothetical protein
VWNEFIFLRIGTNVGLRVTSGFRCNVDEIGDLLGYYAAFSVSSVPTFRDNLSVPPSRVKKAEKVGTELPFSAV